jgi:hypothetical protein
VRRHDKGLLQGRGQAVPEAGSDDRTLLELGGKRAEKIAAGVDGPVLRPPGRRYIRHPIKTAARTRSSKAGERRQDGSEISILGPARRRLQPAALEVKDAMLTRPS